MALKGRKLTEEHKKKIGEGHKKRIGIHKLKGVKKSEEIKKKISETMRGRPAQNKGEKCNFWKGGVSSEEFKITRKEEMAGRKKPEQCEICGAMGRICFDHNHITGKFRGWICSRCNVALGLVKDNTETLQAMINYLK